MIGNSDRLQRGAMHMSENDNEDSMNPAEIFSSSGEGELAMLSASDMTPRVNDDCYGDGEVYFTNGTVKASIIGSSPYTRPGEVKTFRVVSPVEVGSKLEYMLFAQYGTIRMTAFFDGSTTTISFFIKFVRDQRTVNIVFDGNPFGYPLNKRVELQNVNGTTIYIGALTAVACFLRGTLIETPDGPVPVETLSIGDKVVAYREGSITNEPLCWVGKRTVHAYSDAERPVRVRAHALADNVPSSDLLITPEHCLYLERHFVPVRMLVNGSSIVIDPDVTFDVYHIETEHHAVIKANGAFTETFLDTGNRSGYSQSGDVIGATFKPLKRWETDAAAPLGIARSLVEPLYDKLRARAQSLSMAVGRKPVAMTEDPDLHLEIGPKIFIRPLRRTDKGYVFELPAGVRTVWICSRTGKPSTTIGPFVDDRRDLGVLIGEITVYGSRGTRACKYHLAQRPVGGWHGYENSLCRWTAGRARLDLDGVCDTSPSLMMVTILAAGPYLEQAEEECLASSLLAMAS